MRLSEAPGCVEKLGYLVGLLGFTHHGSALQQASRWLLLLPGRRLEWSLDVDLETLAVRGLDGRNVPGHSLENSLHPRLVGVTEPTETTFAEKPKTSLEFLAPCKESQ